MNILVTGANGFCGRLISEYLVNCHHNVLKHSRDNKLESYFSNDENNLKVSGIDVVVNTVGVSPGQANSINDYIESNIFFMKRLLKSSVDRKVKKIINLSTISVYGEINDLVVNENTNIINPDIYGMTKKIAEDMLLEANQVINSMSIRLPGVIGLGSKRNLLSNLRAKAIKGEDIHIYNADCIFNNAIHVYDLAVFIESLATGVWTGANIATVGSKDSIKFENVIEVLLKTLGSKSKIIIGNTGPIGFTISNSSAISFGYLPRDIASTIRCINVDYI